ncbi:hypothetical protein KAM622c_56430 (plasmid) [Klebsiella quasipneumoniae subsp. quasipneumoniae]|nr:hypothetical protein KAM622c_56430 [Klebsiella quasipneumoniae subsp. quasipneumoniae]
MSANIKNSEAFKAAASKGRTQLDIKKSEELCSAKQLDVAEECRRRICITGISAIYK